VAVPTSETCLAPNESGARKKLPDIRHVERNFMCVIVYHSGQESNCTWEASMTDERLSALIEALRVRAMARLSRYAVPQKDREEIWDAVCTELIERFCEHRFPTDDSFLAYAQRILQSRFIDHQRRRRSPIEKAMGTSHETAHHSATARVGDTSAELNDLLSIALPSDARLLRLYADGNTLEQIAVLENRSASQIRRRFSAAINRLKVKVSDH
jgi:RNA polymerase sigma factor (sigma-70 family)